MEAGKGRRATRRLKRAANPPVVNPNPPPVDIPEDVHTSPHKTGNPNTGPNAGQELRAAPPGVHIRERTIHNIKDHPKLENEIAQLKNKQTIDYWNESLDKRCASLALQAQRIKTRAQLKNIASLDEEALQLAGKARENSQEVEGMGENAVQVPAFLFKHAVLP